MGGQACVLYGAAESKHRHAATPERIGFWLLEMRTPGLLIDVAQQFPADIEPLTDQRPLLRFAALADLSAVTEALHAEERAEREADRRYWKPLLAELQRLRWARSSQPDDRGG